MRKRSISKFKLHSIPILHKSKRLRCVSYSIPLTCALALLLLISNLFVIDSVDKSYAEEGVSTYATTPDPTVSLMINGGTSLVNLTSNATAGGDTAYTTPATVEYNASDVSTYALQISYAKGSTGLARENTTNSTTIGGADGKTGSTLADNTWGYAWVDNSTSTDTASLSSATYYTVPTYGTSGTNLATGQLESGNNAGSGTNKLVFAAKFGSDAIAGHYKASVLLSLAVTPKELTLGFGGESNRITTMQEMTPEVCASAEIGEAGTGILKDTRDNSIYNVTRLDDGNCWMTSNLTLTKEGIAKAGNSPKLTSADSNIADDSTFIMPDSIETLSSTDPKDFSAQIDYNSIAQIYDGGSKNANWKPSYGSYYNWYAATAGTSAHITGREDANGSVCPKGWKLPNSDELATLTSSTSAESWSETDRGYYFSGGFFPAAGYVIDGAFINLRNNGLYWSRSSNGAGFAFYLNFNRNQIVPGNNGYRYTGRTLRCLAPSAEPEPEKTWETMETMQEMTSEICEKASIGDAKTLTDTRDGSTYTVGKLSDGKCWMTQNLRLVDKDITSADSDVNANFTIPASATWTSTSYTKSHVYYNNDVVYGAYYNWYAATAGAGTDLVVSGDTESSICPRGWKLPEVGADGEFQKLYEEGKSGWTTNGGKSGYWIGGTANAVGAAFFPAAGFMAATSGGYVDKVGDDGYYWSSTANSNNMAHGLYLDNAGVYPANKSYKYLGRSVRCVAR